MGYLSCRTSAYTASHFYHSVGCTQTSHKKVSWTKQVHVGMEPSTTNQTRWEWYHNTFTPSLHLVPFFANYDLFLLAYVGSAGCVVHVDVHGECVCCGWMQCSSYWARQVSFDLYAQPWAVLGLYGVLGVVKLRCEILLLLNVADMDCLLCGRLWSE